MRSLQLAVGRAHVGLHHLRIVRDFFVSSFSEHRAEKRYVALIAGRFERSRPVELTLAVARHHPARVEVSESGRRCRLHATPLEVYATATLVEVVLETGFLHQIRASLALSPADRLRRAESLVSLSRAVHPRARRNQVIGFDTLEDFALWKKARRAGA